MVTWHFCLWYGDKFNWSLQVVGYRGFARQPCCMAGTMKIFCIWKNFFSHGKRNLLFLPCNMATVQNLYCFQNIVSVVAVYSFIWWHSFQFDIFKGKRYENCTNVLLRLRGVKLKCNLIKSDFQHIRNFFSSFLFSVK